MILCTFLSRRRSVAFGKKCGAFLHIYIIYYIERENDAPRLMSCASDRAKHVCCGGVRSVCAFVDACVRVRGGCTCTYYVIGCSLAAGRVQLTNKKNSWDVPN